MKTASQIMTFKKECKHSTVFSPAENEPVRIDTQEFSEEITSGIYVSKSVLARLGDPKALRLTIEGID